jgi:Repeat of unknown function (DUF5648)
LVAAIALPILGTHVMNIAIKSTLGSLGIFAAIAAAQPPAQRSNYPPIPPARRPAAAQPQEQAPAPREQAAPTPGYKSVYRLIATDGHEHLFTTDASETDRLVRRSLFRMEGIGFTVLDQHYEDSVPLFRFVRPDGFHFLSTEANAGAAEGVRQEGVLGYVDTQPRPGTRALNAWRNPQTGATFYTADRTGEQAPQIGLQFAGVVGYVGK